MTNAEFSKQVNWTSRVRNSTRHPMTEWSGGGLNLQDCQLVDCKFYKKAGKLRNGPFLPYRRYVIFHEKTRSDRDRKDVQYDGRGFHQLPPREGFWHEHQNNLFERRYIFDSQGGDTYQYNHNAIFVFCSDCSAVIKIKTCRSYSLRSSQAMEIIFHLQSQSDNTPFHAGEQPESVIWVKFQKTIIGAKTANWSYKYRASSTSPAWIVSCRHEHPIPKPIQSI